MNTYKSLFTTLKQKSTVNLYKPIARLKQMVTIMSCADIVSIVENGDDWRVTLIRKSDITERIPVLDVESKTTSECIFPLAIAGTNNETYVRY